MTTLVPIELTVNGRPRSLEVAAHHTLLDVLRDDLALTGTKECCLVGECGACTVSLDGRIVDSCLVLAVEADGGAVTTVEGLAQAGSLTRLQQAFLDHGAAQCGFCIPGQLVAAQDLLDRTPRPTVAEVQRIRRQLQRCAGTSRSPGGHGGRSRETMTARVGGSLNRVGGIGRVTGAQEYVADIHLAGELHVKLVTVPCARARIVSIDASPALAIPGVRLVMTAADLPQPVPRFGPQSRDRPVLAVDEVKYHGEPVAAVAAETKDGAEEAAALVRVTFEELPAVTTIAAALDPGAPLVQDPSLRPNDPFAGTNVLREHRVGWGDVDATPADLVVDHHYTFPMVTQFAIEPHAYIAAPDGDGIAVWSTIQHPNWLQRILAGITGLPLSKVRVLAPDPGGGFGGKQHAKYEPLVALMALRAGRPVRLVLTLEETFQAVRRAASDVRVRTGLLADGTICFQDVTADYLIGAYVDIADRVVGKGSYLGAGPYRMPAARVVARPILSHTVPSTAFRGFGNPQVNWAVESNLDEAAHRLGIDGLEIRLRNLAAGARRSSPGTRPRTGTGRRPSAGPPSWSAGTRRCRRRTGAGLRWGSSPGRRRACRTRRSGCSPTAASSSMPAPRTWARAHGPCSRRSPPTSSARRSTG
jgi:CO/xanthine dehydrogenase Mo-binding subunit/aerobic-type carbon monoxide dehydrogenase small subunit (CoxS/CutS family)